jgi:hypothetical protein
MLHNFCCVGIGGVHEVEQRRLKSTNRTLWDLLVVLGVLIVGAGVGYWLSEQRNAARYQEVENELAKLEQELAGEKRSQNAAALQAYFEQMTHLLLQRDLRASAKDSEVQRLARARTLAIVANSDAQGNRSVTRFLTDLDLVKGSDPVRLLSQSHLPEAQLGGAFLPAVDLNTSLLRGADLGDAMLISANLSGAILSDADLGGANLAYTNMQDAVLAGADLSGANLRRAVLTGADLSGADLSGANLTNAVVTDEQLDACKSLKGATMPDGSKHPNSSSRITAAKAVRVNFVECSLRDWLKSRSMASGTRVLVAQHCKDRPFVTHSSSS